MAENITFDINAKDNATATLNKVSNNLQKMQKNVQATTGTFEKFRNTLLGLGALNFVRTAFQFADAIQDISDATNIATASVIGFSTAVAQNGGNAEKAQQSILKLVENIGDAANGSAKAQQAFAQVGITLEDLATLSEQDLLEKTVKGLAGISDYSKRAALQTELLGKSLKGVNIAGVANNLDAATAEGAKYSKSIKSAADAQQNLENSINNLKIALLDVLKPISDVAKELSANIETIKKFIKVALTIGAAVAAFTLFGKIVRGIVTTVELLGQLLLTVGRAILYVGGSFGKSLPAVSNFVIKILDLTGKLLGFRAVATKFATFFAPIVAAIAGGTTAFKLFGSQAALSGQEAEDAIKRMNEESMKAHAESNRRAEEEKTRIREVEDALAKQIVTIQNVTAAYKENQDQFISGINAEARYLQMSNDAVEIAKVQTEIYDRAIAQIKELQDRKAALTDEEKRLIPIIDEQIAAIEKSIMSDQIRAENAIKNVQTIRQAQEELKASIEDTSRAFAQAEALQDLQDQLSLVGLYGEELEKQTVILQAQKALREEMQRLSIELLNLEAQRTQLGEVAYQRERQRITQQMMDVQSLAEAKISAYEQEMEKKKQVDESYAEGASRALKDIAKQYDPIVMAQDAVQKGWGRVTDAIDTFIDTGKFKFSDFARSILADLAKMIAKAMIFKYIFEPLMGALGLPIPSGRAAGGPVKGNTPYIVGEKGPELFVPQGSGKVIPNNQLGKGNSAVSAPITNNYITNNINAVDAKSVAALFYENRKSLLGATSAAQKELPYGMRG